MQSLLCFYSFYSQHVNHASVIEYFISESDWGASVIEYFIS